MGKYIGIDIGGTTIKLAFIDKAGEILEKWQIPTNTAANGKFIPNEIAAAILSEMAAKGIDKTDFLGIGAGVPGPVREGTVLRAVNLGWKDFPLKDLLEEQLQLPVTLLNDANAAALGELWKGSESDVESALFITLGTGVGGGIIVNQQIINGSNASGGEIGHIPVDALEQRQCGCGNINCLECYASANGLLQTMQNMLKQEGATYEVKDTKQLFSLLHKGNGTAEKALMQTVEHLAKAIAGILNTIDPQEVIIGGGLSEAGDSLLVPLKEAINRYAFPQIRNSFVFRKAALGNDAGVYGAAYQILKSVQEEQA